MFKKLKGKVKLFRDLLKYFKSPGSMIIHTHKEIESNEAISNWCFFVQGPIPLLKKDELKQLRRAYPKSQIILSTWHEDNIDRSFFNGLNITLVLNHKPRFSGIMNSNYQLVQIKKGLQLIDCKKTDFVVKLRIDVMPRYPHLLVPYFEKLEQNYPNRIWGADINTKIDLPFSLSDICMWSKTENFINYWGAADLVSCDINPKQYIAESKGFTDLDFMAKFMPAEAHYCYSWKVAKNCSSVPFSSEAWNESLKKEIGVFSSLHIGLYFNKYSHFHTVYTQEKMKYLGFEEWLCLQY